MKHFTMTALALISCLTLLPAQGGRGNGKGNGEGRGAKMAQELNLTQEQQDQLKALKTESKDSHKSDREAFKAKKSELNDLLKASSVDKRAIDSKIKEISALTEKKMQNRVEHLLKVKEILTPEQFEKFLEMKEERMKQHGSKGKGQGSRS